MSKRILFGNAIIIGGMVVAIFMTFIYSWMIDRFPKNTPRIDLIFGIGGAILASATILSAFIVYTNNLGSGFKKE